MYCFLGSSAAFGIGSTSNSNTTIPSLINRELGDGLEFTTWPVPSWNSRQELNSIINFISQKVVQHNVIQ